MDAMDAPALSGVESRCALTSLQAGMLFQARLDPDGGFDIEQLTMQLDEPLNVPAFADAWQAVVLRHPMLRTRIVDNDGQEPHQEVLQGWRLPITVVDWRHDHGPATIDLDDDERQRLVTTFLREDRRQGVPLNEHPPLRLLVARVGVARTFACWTFHHILLDGRSFGIVLRDVFAAYDAIVRGVSLTSVLTSVLTAAPRPFSDFVAWSAQQPFGDSLPFWKALLAGKDAPTPLPALRPASIDVVATKPGYGELVRVVAPRTTSALRKLAKRSETTLGTVVQAAWALCLNRLTGDDDVVFGTTRACRRSALVGAGVGADAGADDMVGLFINTLPVRAKIVDDERLTTFLSSLRRQSLDVRAHEHTPLVDVLGTAQVPRGTPLFQSLLMFENQELNQTLRSVDAAFAHRHFHYEEQPTFPLNITVFDHGQHTRKEHLELRVLFDRARYDDVGITRLLGWIEAVCASMTTAKTTGDVRLLPDDERAAVLFGPHNQTARPFPAQTLIHELFEARVDDEALRDQLAVVCSATAASVIDGAIVPGSDVSASFIELERRANQLAWCLKRAGAVPGRYVGILLDRSIDLVVGVLAVAKTGAAYVPLDPEYPRERLSFMLEDTRAPVVVTQRHHLPLLPAGTHTIVLDDDDVVAALAAEDSTRPPRVSEPGDVCYTIYTSGSTGQPKGVVLTHEAVVNTLDWVNRECSFTPADRLLFVTSICFDLSVYDIFGALGAGASIRVATAAELRDPEGLVRRLLSGEITVWDSAPAALHRLVTLFPETAADDEEQRRRRRLRLVMLSGDWIPVSLPDHLRRTFHQGLAVRSLGGATEAAVWSNHYVVDKVAPSWTSIPYGQPIQNSFYHVLDHRLQPVPPGVSGDLYIGGTCLASGYLQREALTAERFIKDPFITEAKARGMARPGRGHLYKTGDLSRYYDDDAGLAGQLEFLGRSDFQVKIRGFRVELGEVDAVVHKLDGVRDALSVPRVDASNQKVLVTYVVPRLATPAGVGLTAHDVKEHVARHLPDFMVPTHVVLLPDGLPVSVNGKVDRKALPDPLHATAKKVLRSPQTATEQALLPIWQGVLGTTELSIDDSFFDRGGHSLLATMLVSRIKKNLAVNVPLSALFSANTIERLARTIDAQRPATSTSTSTSTSAATASTTTTTGTATTTTTTTTVLSSSLIVLNEHGTKTPVFFIAGIGGHVFTFQKLAQLLGPETPSYGFRAIGGESGEVPKERVEDIATAYLAELDARGLTNGPIILCGYSFGGYVAYELALRLERRGVPPELLVFFDVLAPGYPKRLPMHQRALIHVDEFRKHDLAGKRRYLTQRLKNVRGRVLMKLGMAERLAGAADVGAGEFDETRQQEMRTLWGALANAQLQYRPSRTTHIPGLLLKAATTFDWPATRFDDPAHGWRDWLSGTLTVATVDGAHLQLFEGKNPETMATAIQHAER